MLSRKLVKFIGSARITFCRNASSYPKRNPPSSCLYLRLSSRSRVTSDFHGCVTQCHQNKFCSTSNTKAKSIRKGLQETSEKVNRPQTKTLNEEELLEKFVASLSTDIYTKHRVYKNDFQKVLSKVKESKICSKKQGLLLLRCCTDLMPDEPYLSRMTLAEQVWETIKPFTKFEVKHYNELLRVYIANKRTVFASGFIQAMSPCLPDMTTYELILTAIAEAGDLNQAMEVISNMKALGLPASESIFNSLIVCQGKSGNAKNIQEVLTMMQSLKIERSADTYTALARVYVWSKTPEVVLEEIANAKRIGIEFEEKHILDIVKTMAENSLYDFIPRVLHYLPEETLQSPSISPYMQAVTTQLVFQNQPMAALAIYNALPIPSFGPKDDQGLHGRSLVRDCVKASLPSSVIALVAQNLMASGRNTIALQNAAEAALQTGKTPLALDMLQRMKQVGMPVRCHYFWPILLQSTKSYGEKGIIKTLQTMVQMEVIPDHDTMMHYVLPYVSFTSPQNLMKKFLEAGLTGTMALTPMMETLVKTGQVRAASEICELFSGKIDAERLIKPLVAGYQISMDHKSTVHILEDISIRAIDKNKDWVGRYLCRYVNTKNTNDLNDFLFLVRELGQRKVRISNSAADYCLNKLPDSAPEEKLKEFKELLIKLTDETLIDEGEMFTHSSIPHPKHMNEEALRAHLCELEAKGLNTRGVLRKLLQEYCRSGNLTAAREIADKCQREGVFLSAGMKAAIFDLHVKLGELDLAELALADLNKSAPNFLLDEYKVIDFATLMVYRKRIVQAFELINEQSKKRNITGGRNISMNCWRLLDAVAANNSHVQTRNMFELLVSLGYCQPTNVILGPLIRVHLKNANLDEAVKEFVRIADKYKRTPLKHELLCNILQSMTDGISEEFFLTNQRCNGKLNKLAQTVLSVDKKVHGAGDVQLTLIAALADVSFKKTLRKVLLDPTVKFHPDALMRHCERFADEKKIHALETIAECAKDLRHIDVTDVYDLMLDVYQREDDVAKAMELWTKMHEQNITPSRKFVKTLSAMAKSNSRELPAEIVALVEKVQKVTQ